MNNTTTPTPFMGTVDASKPPAQMSTNPIQPTVPPTQPVSTIGTTPINLPPPTTTASNYNTPNLADTILKQSQVADTDTQKKASSLSDLIVSLTPGLQGEAQAKLDAQKAQGIPDMNVRLNSLNNSMIQKQAEIAKDDVQLAADLDSLQGHGILKGIVDTQQYDIAKKAQITRSLKMSDINMMNAQALALQGNIALAKDFAQQAVDLKYAPIKDQINTAKAQLEALQPILTKDEKKQADQQKLRQDILLKQVDQAQKNESDVASLIINASSQGASSDLINKAKDAKTPLEAAGILGPYAGDYWGIKLKIAEYNKTQMESAKIGAELNPKENTQKAQSQAEFLLDTISEANGLADASGRSAALRTAQSWLYGANDYTNLESKVRTIKTNLLTLATDPDIKKFFGPQMTEADVKNMQAAASTLDTEAQTPDQLRAELIRVQSIFQKFSPKYQSKPIKVESWADNAYKMQTTTPTVVNYGYTDNQTK